MNSMETIAILATLLMVVMFCIGVPIWGSLAIAGIVGLWFIDSPTLALGLFRNSTYASLAVYGFSVLPMFTLMGMFASECGFGKDFYNLLRAWVGRIKGSLAISTCLGCALFGTLSGDAISTTITIGKIALPEMEKSGYDLKLAFGSVAAAGPLAAMIPPSVLICLYGIITEQSVGKLLMAGFLPGFINALLFAALIFIRVSINPKLAPPVEAMSWRERFDSLKQVWAVVLCVLAVLGGIYSGITTPTEAGAFAALFVGVVGFSLGRLKWHNIQSATWTTIKTSGMFGAIIVASTVYTYMIVLSGLGETTVNFIGSLNISALGVVLGMMILYLILGCFMSSVSMLFITVPFFMPLYAKFGINPIWAGILFVHMAEIGCITPPYGITLFALQTVRPETSMITVARGISWFLLADLVMLALLLAFPQIVLFVPNLMSG